MDYLAQDSGYFEGKTDVTERETALMELRRPLTHFRNLLKPAPAAAVGKKVFSVSSSRLRAYIQCAVMCTIGL